MAAATLVLLILTASVMLAWGKESTVTGWRGSVPAVKKLGGWALAAVGAWFLLLSVFSGSLGGLFPV